MKEVLAAQLSHVARKTCIKSLIYDKQTFLPLLHKFATFVTKLVETDKKTKAACMFLFSSIMHIFVAKCNKH